MSSLRGTPIPLSIAVASTVHLLTLACASAAVVETVFRSGEFGGNFTVGNSGELYVSDQDAQRILRFDPQTGNLATIAGADSAGFSGDGGLAVAARINGPSGLALGPDGALYFADQLNHRVRRIDLTTGIIETVAGSGPGGSLEGGFSGDEGPATAAELSRPGDVTFDANGNLFITDVANHRIRRVDGHGTITTFAGSGPVGFGRGSDAGDGGPATAATLDRPQRVAVTSRGDVIVAASASHVLRIVDHASGIISRYAGTGIEGFGGDGGVAKDARFSFPTGLALDADDNVYVADQGNCRIRLIERTSGVVTTIAGDGTCQTSGDGGPPLSAQFDGVHELAFQDGRLYVSTALPEGQGIRSIVFTGNGATTTTTNASTTTTTRPACEDADGDGEPDGSDRCPGTPLGEGVDDAGCSREQFCGRVTITTRDTARACKKSDWRNDEPLMKAREADCRVERDSRDPNYSQCRAAGG